MLCPIGWVEDSSQLALIASSSSALTLSEAGFTDCTTKFPFVMVPVLSITIALTFFSASMAIPPLKRIPLLEAAPMPEKNARGTDNTSAHGQLMTRKVSAVYTDAVPDVPYRADTVPV